MPSEAVQRALACMFLGSALLACDPGTTCEPRVDVAVPDGVDPCVRSTYPAPDVAAIDTDAGIDGDTAGADVAAPAYPAAPYGTEVGATIANLTFAVAGGGTLALADVHDDPDARLLFISTAAGWCSACREEQPELVSLYDTHHEAGLRVFVAIFEDVQGNPATDAFATGWVAQYGLPFPGLLDERNQLGAFYDTSLAPMNLFVETDTMTIVGKTIGFDEDVVRALVSEYF